MSSLRREGGSLYPGVIYITWVTLMGHQNRVHYYLRYEKNIWRDLAQMVWLAAASQDSLWCPCMCLISTDRTFS